LSEKEQSEYYFEFNVDGLLRGDIKSRYEAHSRGILSGFLNRNEVRAMENRDAVEGLDEFLTPSNMALGTDPTPDTTQQDQANKDNKQALAEIRSDIQSLSLNINNRPEPEPTVVNVTSPAINVTVPLTVENKSRGSVTFQRDENGDIISALEAPNE
jgi:hypothetical protein